MGRNIFFGLDDAADWSQEQALESAKTPKTGFKTWGHKFLFSFFFHQPAQRGNRTDDHLSHKGMSVPLGQCPLAGRNVSNMLDHCTFRTGQNIKLLPYFFYPFPIDQEKHHYTHIFLRYIVQYARTLEKEKKKENDYSYIFLTQILFTQ